MNGCEGYSSLARFYDQLNSEIDYSAWADFVETCFARYLDKKPELVLDLACGTGSIIWWVQLRSSTVTFTTLTYRMMM